MTAPDIDQSDHPLTIEDLSAATGLSVRNIRSHRARGLLQPPAIRERIGYYGDEHVARLALIARLQADGFNLAAIKSLVERDPQAAGGVLGVLEQVGRPFESEAAQILTQSELEQRFGTDPAGTIERAQELGVLVGLGDGRYEVPAPSLLDIAEELAGRGVPIDHSLKVVEKVRASARSISREFVRLFVDDVFAPIEKQGFPPERWDEVTEGIERLRPMSAQVVLAMYQLAMTEEVERESARLLRRLAKGKRGR